ncbi:hypothetical protein LZC95_43850 [Pendulispora brunnea]|uniref:Uncharacterized protein n=1 Tax=Pendulispora brunnea TaxID=2905690 RepID=A0ABZ2K3V0_9BACT
MLRSKRTRPVLLALLLATTAACNDDFNQGWRIDRTRVLGAKAIVDGDISRASPAPGEAFHVDWFVVSPSGSVPTTWRLTACRRADSGRGSQCDGPSLAEVSGTGNVPTVSLTAPPAGALGDATHLLVWGDIDKTNVDNAVMLQTVKSGSNRNPHIDAADLLLDGQPWTTEDGLCEGALPRIVADDAKHEVALVVRESNRETIDGGRETMQLSHFTTAGRLDRLYSVLDGTDPAVDKALSVSWEAKPDTAPPAGGMVVHFYFGLRDSRGGMDFATRALCMRPRG